MKSDDPFIEECARAAAWADSGYTKIDFSSDVPGNLPDGWPDEVDERTYLEQYVNKYVPKEKTPEPEVAPTPLVDAFRRLLA